MPLLEKHPTPQRLVQRRWGSQPQRPLGPSICCVPQRGGAAMEGTHNHAIVRGWVSGITLRGGWEGRFSILHCCGSQGRANSSSPGRDGSSLQPDAPFSSAAFHYFWWGGVGEPSSWNRLTFMPVSSLWVIALDLGTFRISQELFRKENTAQGPQCMSANLWSSCTIPAFISHGYVRQTELAFLPFPTATAAFILFCLGCGNSFLFPLICPLVHCCQSDISAEHVGSCQRIKSKLLFPTFGAFSNETPNCFSRQAPTPPLACAPTSAFIPHTGLSICPSFCQARPSASALPDEFLLIPHIPPQWSPVWWIFLGFPLTVNHSLLSPTHKLWFLFCFPQIRN